MLRSFLAVLFLTAVSVLYAAPERPTPEMRNLDIAVWYDGRTSNLGALSDLAWLFHQTHKDVIVNFSRHGTAGAYDRITRWATIDPASAPDLLVISGSWVAEFKDALAPLDKLAASAAARKIVPPALELFTVDGHLRAVPWSLAARVLLVRRDLLEAKHLEAPQTWDQVAEVAAALHDPPKLYGIGMPGAPGGGGATLLQEMIWSEGEALLTPTGAVSLDGPGKVRALERYAALARSAPPEVLSWPQTELEGLFAAGRLGMLITDTWVAKSWEKAPGMPAYQVLPLPQGTVAVGRILGDGLAVFAQGKQQELAMQFVQTLLQPQAQQKLVELGGLPVHQSLLAEPAKNPLLAALLPTVAQARILSPLQPPVTGKLLETALYLTLSGRTTATEALTACQQMLHGEGSPEAPPGAPPGTPPED